MRRHVPDWLGGPILAASVITALAGAAQFGVTAALGDVAVAFDVATSADVESGVGMSAGQFGLGLGVIRLAGILALVGSVLADRLGRRLVLLAAAAIGLLATGVATFMPSFWAFVAVIALGRPMLTTTNAIVPVVAAEESTTAGRTSALAYMSAVYAFGAGVVSVLRSVGPGIGYRGLLLGVAATVVVLPLVGRHLRDSPAVASSAGVVRPRFGLVGRQHVRPLVVLCVLAALTNLVTGPALTWLFVYGERVLGASSGRMALLVLAAGPVGLAGLLTGRWAGDRVGRRLTSAIGTAVVPVAAVLTYGADVTTLSVGYLALIFVLGLIGPPVAALLNEVMPTETRATANGWVGASAVVGGVIGLVSFGALIDAMATYRVAASVLWLPLAPLAFGYLAMPEEVADDIAEIDRLLTEERAATVAGRAADHVTGSDPDPERG